MAVKATAAVTVFNVSDGADGRMLYATCPTAAATDAKVATVSSGTVALHTGLAVAVCFAEANTAASPTLNVNGTGAKAIWANGAAVTGDHYWAAGALVTMVYDGARWVMSDVQSVDVGGTNIYLGDIADRVVSSNDNSVLPISSSRMADEPMGMAYRHIVRSGAGTDNTQISFYNSPSFSLLSEPLAPGQTYTASCLVRTNCTCANIIGSTRGYLYSPTLQLLDKVYGPAIRGTGGWERWWMTFTVPEHAGQTGFRILPYEFIFGQGVTWETAYVDLARYKIERGAVATDWSPAPGDVQNGINGAQNTANAGIKEQVTLFYAAASATTPSKPTANVTTSSATTYAAWNRTLPTYRAANPYLYVCTQSLTNGGTYSWSAVEPGSYADWAAALGTRLTTAETQISQNTADIALKASQTEVSSLGTRVSTAEASIDANRAAIALKVSQAQFDAMQVGGTNLVLDSEGPASYTKPSDNAHIVWWNYLSDQGQALLADGGTVTVSFDARVASGSSILVGPYMTMHSGSTNTTMSPSGQSTMAVTEDWQRFSRTLPVSGAANRMQITAKSGTGTSGTVIEVRRVKCETGTMATSWSPAPEDMATVAELEVTSDSITQRVDDLAGDVATVATTANSFSIQLESAVADLTGDISTAQTTANAGVKETVQLFFASNSTAAPAKPTANVTTSSATTYAAWNRTLPTYRAANPYLYTCVQTLTSGGTYAWTNVDASAYPAEVLAASKVASNYLKFDSANGLVVGNQTASTLGGNVQLTADPAVKLRNGTTELATFQPSLVELGKESASATISMCKGAAEIKTDTVNDLGLGMYAQNRSLCLRSIPSNYSSENGGYGGISTESTYDSGVQSSTSYIEACAYDYTVTGSGRIGIDASVDEAALRGQSRAYVMAGQFSVASGAFLYNAGSVLGGHVLYANASGNAGTVTLSESAANFTELEIFFLSNNNYWDSLTVREPDGKTVNMTLAQNTANTGTTSPIVTKTRHYTINGTTITPASKAYECSVSGTNTCKLTDNTSYNFISLGYVVGYR